MNQNELKVFLAIQLLLSDKIGQTRKTIVCIDMHIIHTHEPYHIITLHPYVASEDQLVTFPVKCPWPTTH